MKNTPDWAFRAAYMWENHKVSVEVANEAFADSEALHLEPDPASKSGESNRTIGYSPTANAVIVVITVPDGENLWGANGWRANSTEIRKYWSEGK